MGKFYEAIMGLVVGDALGVPYEFKQRDSFKAEDMIGYGTHNQHPGTWSDDSSMTLATVESMARLGKIDLQSIMHNFFNWRYMGKFTPHGDVFDIGGTTQRAIDRYYLGFPIDQCGGRGEMDNGNGSLMRILPIAFVPKPFENVHQVSGVTHNHPISRNACELYIAAARDLLFGGKKGSVLNTFRFLDYRQPFDRLKQLDRLTRDEIKSSGYVVDTLEAALWCFLKADSYRECVLMAVNLGGDTDTIAAVAGGLAGIYYGIGGDQGIPEEWIDQIVKKDMIKDLCDRFEGVFC